MKKDDIGIKETECLFCSLRGRKNRAYLKDAWERKDILEKDEYIVLLWACNSCDCQYTEQIKKGKLKEWINNEISKKENS